MTTSAGKQATLARMESMGAGGTPPGGWPQLGGGIVDVERNARASPLSQSCIASVCKKKTCGLLAQYYNHDSVDFVRSSSLFSKKHLVSHDQQ